MTDEERKQAEEILIEKEILYEHEGKLRFNEDIILRGFVRIFTEALEAYAALKVAEEYDVDPREGLLMFEAEVNRKVAEATKEMYPEAFILWVRSDEFYEYFEEETNKDGNIIWEYLPSGQCIHEIKDLFEYWKQNISK